MQLASVLRRLGRTDAAWENVRHALQLGRRQRLARGLLESGRRIPALLREWQQAQGASIDPVLGHYVGQLLAIDGTAARPPAPSARPTVAEALSEREIEIVELLGEAMPNKKIARILGVSPETVKWHLKKVYLKLGVTSRDEAVARLRDQGPSRATTGTSKPG